MSRWISFTSLLALCAAWLIPISSDAGRTVRKGVSLDDMVRRSDRILAVEVADPAFEKRTIRIKGKSVETGESVPPLVYRTDFFEVVEVLHGDPLEGRIEVSPADLRSRLIVHKKYHLEGTHKSPIRARYKPGKDVHPDDEGRLIIFVRNDQKYGLLYVVGYGREAWQNLDVVRSAIAANQE